MSKALLIPLSQGMGAPFFLAKYLSSKVIIHFSY